MLAFSDILYFFNLIKGNLFNKTQGLHPYDLQLKLIKLIKLLNN